MPSLHEPWYDARLVLLTFNVSDFARLTGWGPSVVVVDPGAV